MLPPHSRSFLLPIVQVYYDPQFDELRFQPRHAPELFEASSASTANSLKSTFAIFRRLCLAKPFISPGDITPPLLVKITSLYHCHPEIEEESSRSLVRLSACRCGCQDCTGQDRLGDGRKNGAFLLGNAVTLSKQVMNTPKRMTSWTWPSSTGMHSSSTISIAWMGILRVPYLQEVPFSQKRAMHATSDSSTLQRCQRYPRFLLSRVVPGIATTACVATISRARLINQERWSFLQPEESCA